ncbi:ATP-binding protein [Desulfosporosinus sp. PR]|uniref:ATP-binding protein n=1 Tax=Candidatus Desulfosporosinus nitrosoreducens TaxID=3401928 RepID=UPI0027E9C849|nr:ATP-binding protein [Desulfosporosinus sp. PR]MDQ7093805.1 ATP-binding protein [Desulfosporosinus sp. PR]
MGFFQFQHITAKYEKDIEEILTYINFDRTRKLSIILFLANITFLFVDYINKADGLWANHSYRCLFYSHVALGLVTIFYIIIGYYRIKAHSANDMALVHKIYVIFFASFILSLATIISGWIDQKIHGQITVYVMICITIAVVYNYKPKITAFLYGSCWIAFMIFLGISQKDPNIRQGNYLNAFLLVVLSYFLSVMLYKLKIRDLIHEYHLENMVAERTKELQTANDLLTQEIFERKRAEEEIIRLDRLNLVGEMAASISHEVRNPMTTVKGFLQLLKDKQDPKGKEYFDLMIEELDRANSILSEFLSISKNKATMYEWCNINDIVISTLPLIHAEALNNDKFLTVELSKVPDLQLDIQEIRQLLLNLVRNGFEAMPKGGQLKIRTFSSDTEVTLGISDEGDGIEQSILEKLGTPFFTTKEQGTGLGLAVCYGIASRHNGRISVETSPKGTTFYVYFELSK